MSLSSLLQIFQITESQSQKAVAVNLAVSQLEQAIADIYEVDTTAASVVDYDLLLEYDDTNDLTARTALRCIYMVLSGDATAQFNVIHPEQKHLFFIRNNSAYTATVKTSNVSSTGIAVPGGAFLIAYCDGTEIVNMSNAFSVASITQRENYAVSFYPTPTASEVVAKFIVPYETYFNPNFLDSHGTIGTNPAASFTLSVKKNGTEVGTVTIGTTGAYSFATTGATQVNFAAGDILTIVAPATIDTTIAGVLFSLNAYTVVTQ